MVYASALLKESPLLAQLVDSTGIPEMGVESTAWTTYNPRAWFALHLIECTHEVGLLSDQIPDLGSGETWSLDSLEILKKIFQQSELDIAKRQRYCPPAKKQKN